MKKLFFLLCICVSLSLSKTADAQLVTIPDANFVTWLTVNYPTCMSGNQLDTTCSGIVNETSVDCSGLNIYDLTGIQYFDNLYNLTCSLNQLSVLSSLPSSISLLDCDSNPLSLISNLPPTLTSLICYMCSLTNLPVLPQSLTYLDCSSDLLDSLPTLPNSLNVLFCGDNNLTSISFLPNSIVTFGCEYGHLSTLPALPNSLKFLSCDANLLTSLPSLPNSLTYLRCSYNQLTSIPVLPDSLYGFECENNPGIICFPHLNKIVNFNFVNTGITCLPNYPIHNLTSTPDISSVPLCHNFNPNGCQDYSNLNSSVENSNLTIYPNPATDELNILFSQQGKYQIKILDLYGREIKSFDSKSNLTFNISDLTSGIYTMEVRCDNYFEVKKFVKD